MRKILWIKAPQIEDKKEREAFLQWVEKEFKDEVNEVRVLVSFGDVEIKLFDSPLYTYPYWFSKLRKLLHL